MIKLTTCEQISAQPISHVLLDVASIESIEDYSPNRFVKQSTHIRMKALINGMEEPESRL